MTTYEKIQALCVSRGFAISNIGKHVPNIRATAAAVGLWKKGQGPEQNTLNRISVYFGVPVEWLKTEDDSPIPDPEYNCGFVCENMASTEDEQELLKIFRNLAKRQKTKLLNTAYDLMDGGTSTEETPKKPKSLKN